MVSIIILHPKDVIDDVKETDFVEYWFILFVLIFILHSMFI